MSTSALMRGSGSPLRTRRSSASEEGRRFVGSIPTRLYIVLTAAISSGGCARTAASAAASGASSRGSRSTTVAPDNQNTPGRTIAARSGATEKVTIALRVGFDDLPDALRDLPGVGARQRRRVDRLVHDKANVPRIRGQPSLEHDVAAADDRDRDDRQAGF